MKFKTLTLLFFPLALLASKPSRALEIELDGLLELSISSIESDINTGTLAGQSHLNGGYGKFASQDTSIQVSHIAFSLNFDWDSNFSARFISDGYLGSEKDGIGITEAYLKYRSLPNTLGFQTRSKLGIFYPKISLENIAVGWSTPFTLTPSTQNSWLGQEVRHFGWEFEVASLGKFHDSKFDHSISATLFTHNDSNGALLAWQGWTQTSRQTLWTESIALPNPQIREQGEILQEQASQSSPFTEMDDRLGHHVTLKSKWNRRIELSVGTFDNNAKPYVLSKGNYGWHTKFEHLGAKIATKDGLRLIAQYMKGTTLMQSKARQNIVYNDFDNWFLLLSKKIDNQHRFTLRYERFSVGDMDYTENDDNAESGNAITLAYINQLSSNYFLLLELNHIESTRASRLYDGGMLDNKEMQINLGIRYYL
jgi:hypothetical protein